MNKTNLITFALLIAILAAVIITAVIPVAFADPTLNPQNGHYYEYVGLEYDIDWDNAKKYAEGSDYNNVGGYLVTITSQSENDFVTDLIPENSYAWIGMTDLIYVNSYTWITPTGEPYRWVTGELLDYTNWEIDQPDNIDNINPEYDGHYVRISEDTGKWNDHSNGNDSHVTGYVVEYPPRITALNPDNGHYYQYIYNTDNTWTDANTFAETFEYNGITGHLVTITSQSENDFVTDLIPNDSYAWIGLTDEGTEGTFTWVTGEPYDYTNWETDQPNNRYNGEHYAEIVKDTGKWNDSRDNHRFINGYVIEYGN